MTVLPTIMSGESKGSTASYFLLCCATIALIRSGTVPPPITQSLIWLFRSIDPSSRWSSSGVQALIPSASPSRLRVSL
jgi:hypothetical protein